jgi:hypothetical protein
METRLDFHTFETRLDFQIDNPLIFWTLLDLPLYSFSEVTSTSKLGMDIVSRTVRL